MLSREDVVEIVALYRRGWSVSAIARHTGRDRKTVRAWLAGERARRERPASVLEPYRAYVERRLGDDPHLDATVLLRELRPLGFARSYPTLTRELRRLGLRPACPACKRGGHRLTVELVHEPGEELQLDWLELDETPWGEPAHVLVAALSHSGRIRAVLSEGEDFAHLVAALDDVLRRLGGTARCWRTDRMASLVSPQSGRLRPEAAELAKHYGVTVAVCPPRRAQRKGVVEAAIRYIERSWWRSAPVAGVREAQSSLDEWCVEVADARRRGGQTGRDEGPAAAAEGRGVMTEASNSHVTNGDRRAQPDFELRDEGSIVILGPVTYDACVWCSHMISQTLEDWDGGIVIERRYVQDILDGIDDNGLTVGPWHDWRGPQ
jgi:transposase